MEGVVDTHRRVAAPASDPGRAERDEFRTLHRRGDQPRHAVAGRQRSDERRNVAGRRPGGGRGCGCGLGAGGERRGGGGENDADGGGAHGAEDTRRPQVGLNRGAAGDR